MGIPYLEGRNWANWTRDERFFCAVLFEHARREPATFAKWVIENAGLTTSVGGEWDLGYEVAFYRDYLWPTENSARQLQYSAKRTFDLCLFGERSIIVIEAKVFERFTGHQNTDFEKDERMIKGLSGLESIEFFTVALASSKYLANVENYCEKPNALSVFDGQMSWAAVAHQYDDPLLHRADKLYKMKNIDMLKGDPL